VKKREEKTGEGGDGAVRGTALIMGGGVGLCRFEGSQAVPACPSGKGRLVEGKTLGSEEDKVM
jgi:hypothetical protein